MKVHLYRTGVGLLGLAALLLSVSFFPPAPLPLVRVAFFVLLSWAVKRAGFRVAAEVTHSLVNIVDVAALLLLGPVGGAIVSAGGTVLALVTWDRRRLEWRAPELAERALFVAGIRALMALAAGGAYLALGGTVAPRALSAGQILPLLALFFIWFSLDHLLWTGHALLSGGREGATLFLREVAIASLAIELLPLPFAYLFAVGWTVFDFEMRLLLAAAVVSIALMVRVLARALRDSTERLQRVSVLSRFGEAVLQAQLDESRLSALLFEYIRRVVEPTCFGLVRYEDGEWHVVAVAGDIEQDQVRRLARFAERFQGAPIAQLLPSLNEHAIRAAFNRERPLQRGYGLLAPLVVGDSMLGAVLVAAGEPMTRETGQFIAALSAYAAAALQNARHYRQEQWRVLQLETIAEVSRRVAAIVELDELLDQVVDLVRETFGYYHVQIYLVDREHSEVVFRAGSGPVGEAFARHPPRFTYDHSDQGIIVWVAVHAEPLVVNDVGREPRYIRENARLLPNTAAEMAVPLKVEDRVLGVLDVQADRRDAFDDDDLFTISTLADQVAIAIEAARLYAAQREETWVTTALLQVAESLSPLTRLAEVLETTARITPILSGASSTAIFLWDEGEERFELGEAYGLPRDAALALAALYPRPEEFALLAEAMRQLVAVDEATESALVPDRYARLLLPAAQAETRQLATHGEAGQERPLDVPPAPEPSYSLIAAPLVAQSEIGGVLLLGFLADAPPLDERRRALVTGIAQQAAVAIQAARLYAAQREEAWITTALLQVAEAVASRSDLGDVLRLITRLTVMLAEVEHCAIYLWNDEKRALVPAESCGFPPEVEAVWRSVTLAEENMPPLLRLRAPSAPLVLAADDVPAEEFGLLRDFFGDRLVAAVLQARGEFLGLLVVDLARDARRLGDRGRAILSGVARQVAIAVENAQLYEEALENERRTQELTLARKLQTALLPEHAPRVPGYELAAYWRPAREVAGDFYDFIPLSHDRIGVTIADVADKGMAAALFMVLTRSAVRESVWNEEEVGAALSRANHLLAADATNGMFVTCFLGILIPDEGRFVVGNAGHLPPLVYDGATGSFQSFAVRHLPLGIIDPTDYRAAGIALPPGSFVVLYTDGITEAHDPDMALFGASRLSDVVWRHRHQSAHEIVAAIISEVTAFTQGEPIRDDQSVVVLKRSELVD